MLRKPTGEHKREAVVIFNPETDGDNAGGTATLTRKKRVAAYARVSTEQDAQQNSYEAQIEFYTGYIQSKPEWEFIGVYAEEERSYPELFEKEGYRKIWHYIARHQ